MSKTVFDRISASLRKHAMKDCHYRPYDEKGNYIFLVYDPYKHETTHYSMATLNNNFTTLVEALIHEHYEDIESQVDYETFLKEILKDIWNLRKDKTGNDTQPMLPGMEE
ncbi:MAG: hypothetical protein J6Y20_05610 [Lachnospiraceae bacterium]|nr:hypothetical protein [Lachnospiraceae bacterium]